MTPKTWGKYFWYTIHLTALGYSEKPTFEDKIAYKSFYESIGKVLPCKKCTINFARHFADMPIDPYLIHGKRKLFDWTVYLHNTVNKELGKPQWNTDYAWDFYKTMCKNGTNAAERHPTSHGVNHTYNILVVINLLIIMLVVYRLMKN